MLDVRTIVHLNSHIEKVVEKDDPGWQNTESLVMVKYSRNQSSYEDPTYVATPTSIIPLRASRMRQKPLQHCLPGTFHYVSLAFQYHHKNVQTKKVEQVTTGALKMVERNWSVITAQLVQHGFVQKE